MEESNGIYMFYLVIAVMGLLLSYFIVKMAVKDAIKDALKDRQKDYNLEKERLDSLFQSKVISEAEYNSRRLNLPAIIIYN